MVAVTRENYVSVVLEQNSAAENREEVFSRCHRQVSVPLVYNACSECSTTPHSHRVVFLNGNRMEGDRKLPPRNDGNAGKMASSLWLRYHMTDRKLGGSRRV